MVINLLLNRLVVYSKLYRFREVMGFCEVYYFIVDEYFLVKRLKMIWVDRCVAFNNR